MIGKRIAQARKSASLSLRALAQKVGVSQTTISKYEKEQSTPDSTMLIALAKALGVKVAYFFKVNSGVTLSNLEYRKRKVSQKELESIKSKVINLVEKRLELESLYPKAESVKFEVPNELPEYVQYQYNIDDVAKQLREIWNLGEDPIADLSEILESKGIKVFMIDESANNNFDGLAGLANGEQIITISKDWTGDRQRFTLAHELGHLILDGRLDSKIDEERASDRFAGAFLLPEKALKEKLGETRKSLEIAELAMVKAEFGVSMQVVFIRANQVKIISYDYSNSLWKLFKKEGWDIKEPSEPYPQEKVQRFKQLVLRAVSEESISESKGAELLDMSVKKFHNYRMTGK